MDAFLTKIGKALAKSAIKAADALESAAADYRNRLRHTPDGLYLEGSVLVGIDPGLVKVKVPHEVNEIAENAFNQGTELEEITFMADLQRIGARAFCSMPKLRYVSFEGAVYEIGDDAFRGCESLETVEFCDGMYEMGSRVFQDCTALKEIRLADDLLTMGKAVFSGCYQLEHVHLPKALKIIPSETFEDCALLETIDWPIVRRNDGHDYPIVAPFAFRGCLADDYWERFELKDGVMRRSFVEALENDPVGLFDMMIPGETQWIDWVPQRIVHGILNLAWESSALNTQQLAFKMQVYQFCLGLVNLLVIRENNDNRAERLVVLYKLKLLLLRCPDLTVSFVRHVLPHAIQTTLLTIDGNGKSRRAMDRAVSLLFEPYYDEYIEVQKYKQSVGEDELDSDDEENTSHEYWKSYSAQPIYHLLGIGPDIPFRYDPTRYRDLITIPEDFIDYYVFSRAMESLSAQRFGVALKCDRDLDQAPQAEWFSVWAKIIDEWDNDFALVILKPSVAAPHFYAHSYYQKRLEPILRTDLILMFVAILHRAQIEAIRSLLAPYRMEDMLQVYSYALEII